MGRASGLRPALGFLSVLGGAAEPTPAAVTWFPMLGAGMGLVLGGFWLVVARFWPPPVAAALVVLADLALTGMLHFDGLVDSADGLLSPMDRARRLAVMDDPSVGAFGLGAGVLVLLLRWVALSALAASPLLLATLWCASRSMMAIALRWSRPARSGGMTAKFASRPGRSAVGGTLIALFAMATMGWLGSGVMGLIAAIGALGAGAGVVGLARRRLGGYTGDVLGAAGVVGETAGLLLAAARW